MSYRYLDDITVADAAFEATGKTPEELFLSAAEALLHLMHAEPGSLRTEITDQFEVSTPRTEAGPAYEDLLFSFLEKLLHYKDADAVLMKVSRVRMDRSGTGFRVTAEASGTRIRPGQADLGTDVKAITHHRYQVKQTPGGWMATVVVDV